MISIIILSHNAPIFTKHTLIKLKKTKGVDFETIVLDNDSSSTTLRMLKKMKEKGYIDKLIIEKENTLFSKGNNIASKYCAAESSYILLLNSDVDIRDNVWLKKIFGVHRRGATALGVCENNPVTRGDGFCFLIDRDLYEKYELDEKYEWWWSVTKLQAQLLNDQYSVSAVKNYDTLLYHYGGMSGEAWKTAKGMKIEGDKIKQWFLKGANGMIIIDRLLGTKNIYYPWSLTNIISLLKKGKNKLKKIARIN